MSRTYRKRESYQDEEFLNLLNLLLSEIKKDNSACYLSEDGSFYVKNINSKIESLIGEDGDIENIKKFILEEINKEKRHLKKLTADKRNWRGSAIRLTKEYSNMKSRSGKRDVINTVIKNVDLKDLDGFNDIPHFAEPKLGSIKGAIWIFD